MKVIKVSSISKIQFMEENYSIFYLQIKINFKLIEKNEGINRLRIEYTRLTL
jgi:hypothetical protein